MFGTTEAVGGTFDKTQHAEKNSHQNMLYFF